MSSLSVIIPFFNERAALPWVFEKWVEQLEVLAQTTSDFEILFVNDGSDDGGPEWVKMQIDANARAKTKIRLLDNPKNLGYGATLKRGIRVAKYDWVLFHDCDRTCWPDDFQTLWQSRNEALMVVGQRQHAGSRMPWLRKVGNLFYQQLYQHYFHTSAHDVCSGYRLLHRETVLAMLDDLPDELNFTLNLSILFAQRGLTLNQTYVRYDDRLGESKLSVLSDGLKFFQTLYRHRQ